MCTIERVRLILPNGEVAVRDYAFSQICELTEALSKDQRKIFYSGKESVITERDSHFAAAGTSLKYMGIVS